MNQTTLSPWRAAALYNKATSPGTYRTDAEHASCRRAARRVLAIIRRHSLPVMEQPSGRLIVRSY